MKNAFLFWGTVAGCAVLFGLREAWESLPQRTDVHSVAVKEHAGLIAWAKAHPADLLQQVGGSFTSGDLGGYWINSDPPTILEKLQGTYLVQTTDWTEIERLAAVNVAITKLPADEVEEANRDLVAQIRGLPKGNTRKIADHLILAVDRARSEECELEELAESLSEILRDRGEKKLEQD